MNELRQFQVGSLLRGALLESALIHSSGGRLGSGQWPVQQSGGRCQEGNISAPISDTHLVIRRRE
jgi:hypothetical protein